MGLRLVDRFAEVLAARGERVDPAVVALAVALARLAVRALDLFDPSVEQRAALRRAIGARTGFDDAAIDRLIELALDPEYRSTTSARDVRAFAARFGEATAAALSAEEHEELELSGFADRYGPTEAVLLLDALFAVSAAGGRIARSEVGRLQDAARTLGVDGVLVSALFRKHDPRHAAGDLRFPLSGDRVTIGRSPRCEVVLPDPQVALRHAELVRVGGGEDSHWRVVDLGSGRPTVVGGAAVRSAPLALDATLRIGPYALRLAGDELVAFGSRSFSSLSVRGLGRRIGGTTILDGIDFTVFSGEVVAVVGPSGAGKTTLLDALSGVAPPDEGRVLLDGEPFDALLDLDPSLVGIVPQDDQVLPELTVEESLYYSGRLRFPPDVTHDEIRAEVDRVLDELDIESIRGSRVGDALRRGISGGQRKRVNLGQELLTRSTRVLFLDEPTSGLDPWASQGIVRLVRQLADHGRIVFLGTHDLTPEIVTQVDHLLVLAPGGRLACFAPPDEVCAWFGVSTADAIFHRFAEHRPEEWARRFRESALYRKYVTTREHLVGLEGVRGPMPIARPRRRHTPLLHFATLTARYARTRIRDRTSLAVLAVQPPVLAGVMWVVFPTVTSPMLFMLSLSVLWFGMSAAVRELIIDRVTWRRERRVGVGVLAYLGSKVAVLGVLVALQCAVLTGLVYAGLGLGEAGFSLVRLLCVTTLTGLAGMGLGLLVSASWTSSEAAVGSLPLLLIPQITFSSIMVSIRDMSPLGRAVTWAMVERYAFDAVLKCGRTVGVRSLSGRWEQQPIRGELWKLGLKLSAHADDTGLSLGTLTLAIAGFATAFLVAAGVVVWRRR